MISIIWIVIFCSVVMSGQVTWDHKSIKLDGKRVLLNVGSMHYSRSLPSQWPHILDKSVAAGINAIDSYVFWNYHEVEEGVYDFSTLISFLKLIKERYNNKLHVVLRIGPYVCAEWNYGGIPTRLKFIDGMVFRTDNELFKREMEKFTRKVIEVTEKYFYTRNGPIILLQIENEYGNIQKDYGYSGQDYILWAVNMALSITSELPWFVCQQNLNVPFVINTCNGFYCHEWLNRTVYPYSQQPPMFTENWTGWFTRWGDVPPRRPAEDLAYATLIWFAHGGTYNSYYMWHGGTNFARWAGGPQGEQIGAGFITSYDYDAPLNEYGFPNEPKYTQLAILNKLLLKYQDYLLEGDKKVLNKSDYTAISYSIKEKKLLFVINSNVNKSIHFTFVGDGSEVPRWSISVFFCESASHCMFLYNTAKLDNLPVSKSYYVPLKIYPSSVHLISEDMSMWKSHSNSNGLQHSRPREHLSVTRDKTDYLSYFLDVSFEDGIPNNDVEIKFNHISDYFYLFWNEKLVHAGFGGRNLKISVPVAHLQTDNEITIVTQTLGLTNYGTYLERWERGILDQVVLNNRDISYDKSKPWKHFPGLVGELNKLWELQESSKFNWVHLDESESIEKGFSWYKLTFQPLEEIDVSKLAYVLQLSTLNKGFFWVNGHAGGRYWSIKTKIPTGSSDNGEGSMIGNSGQCDYAGTFDPNKCRDRPEGEYSQEYYHVPIEWLNYHQNNEVVIFEERENIDPFKVQFAVAELEYS